MLKDRINGALDWILKHSLIVFPVIVCAAVAVTVALALSAGKANLSPGPSGAGEPVQSPKETESGAGIPDVPLVENTDDAVYGLIMKFYNAAGLGDMETLVALYDQMSDEQYFQYQEVAKYVESYPVVEIYTKPGYEEGSTMAYVYFRQVFVNHEEEFPGWKGFYICTNEEGGLYIKGSELSREQFDYVNEVNLQDDVVAFNNRITVEYNELIRQQPEWAEYMEELEKQLETAVGVQIAKKNAEQEKQQAEEQPKEGEPSQEASQEQPTSPEPTVQYVTATTTVNVRSSDSENADRLGKVSGGTKLELKEARVNGWSMVVFEGKDAFIKSQYLEPVESAEGLTAIGTVTATTNINVRASASETAERLGILAGGETVDLYARENGWCKIKYQDQAAYVKADYVQ